MNESSFTVACWERRHNEIFKINNIYHKLSVKEKMSGKSIERQRWVFIYTLTCKIVYSLYQLTYELNYSIH